MPRKPKLPRSEAPLAPVPPEILDQFVRQGPISHEELDAAVRRFKKALIERALVASARIIWALHRADPSPTTTPIIATGSAARPS